MISMFPWLVPASALSVCGVCIFISCFRGFLQVLWFLPHCKDISKLSVLCEQVCECVWMCPEMVWHPVQGISHLVPRVSWDRFVTLCRISGLEKGWTLSLVTRPTRLELWKCMDDERNFSWSKVYHFIWYGHVKGLDPLEDPQEVEYSTMANLLGNLSWL